MMRITTLTSQTVASHLVDLLSIEHSAHDMSSSIYSVEKWTELEFSKNLPGKFEHSMAAWSEEKIIAFLISSKPSKDILHVHRIAVHQDFQRMGISKQLMGKLSEHFESDSRLQMMTAIVNVNNIPSLTLFKHFDFVPFQGERLKSKLVGKEGVIVSEQQDRYMDVHGMIYYYLYKEKRRDEL